MKTIALAPHNSGTSYLLAIVLGITGSLLLVLFSKYLFFALGFFILLVMLLYLLNDPVKGVLLFLSTKCIFDMFWFIRIPVTVLIDLNVQRAIGILFPLAILGIFVLKERNFFKAFSTTLGKIILLYIAFNALAIFLASSAPRALVQFSQLIGSFILFFVLGVTAFTEKDLRALLHYLLVFLWIPLVIAFLETFGLVSFSSFIQNAQYVYSSSGGVYAARLVGLYSHPFDVVRYLVVAFPLALWMMSTEANPFKKLFYNITFLFLSFAMWRTFYRTGWIIFALQLVFWLKMRKSHKAMLAVILICVCVVLMNLTFFTSFYDTLLVLLSPSGEDVMTAFSGRFVIWSFHLAKFAESSRLAQLFGHGLGSEIAIYHEMSDVLSSNRETSHSDFIRNLSEIGIAGLGLYLLVLILLGKELLSSIKREEDPSFRAFGQAIFLIFIGFLLLSNVAAPALNPSIAWYLWGFAGVVIGRKFLNNKLQQKQDHKK